MCLAVEGGFDPAFENGELFRVLLDYVFADVLAEKEKGKRLVKVFIVKRTLCQCGGIFRGSSPVQVASVT